MRRFLCAGTVLLSACGGTLYQIARVQSTAAPDDAYQCVVTALQKQGYRRAQHDTMDRWFLAEKEDSTSRISSGLFRKTVNVIDAKVRPDSTGNSALLFEVHTFDEFTTTRGPDRQERKVSERAQLELRAIQEACAK